MRASGILMPIFSLPSKYGIGDFGQGGYDFVDFLEKSKQKIWQVLPLVQTGYGNSPYSSICSNSFNPYFISPKFLVKEGLCTEEEADFSVNNDKYVDYGFLYTVRFPLLRKAFYRFNKNDKEFVSFIESKEYYDYALFMALKYASGQKHFYEWEDKFKFRDEKALKIFALDYSEEILFWQFIQFTAKKQWKNLKNYANKKGINIIGDMPLYVALDSVDVWTNPKVFKIDENFVPKKVAGVPPDYFCKEGQLWGNPVYDYDVMQKDNFSWWVNRLKQSLEIFDYVRIDHFRGFDKYYEVDNGAKNAICGEWIKVPSKELFNSIHKSIDGSRIIAEDLGIIDDGVRLLLKETNYPGMKILSFAFNGESDNLYLPERVEENSICYTGTHDNDTLKGLIENSNDWNKDNLVFGVKNSLARLGVYGDTDSENELIDSIIELGFKCKSKIFIFPLQDILKYGSDYRINEPGSVKPQNWAVRFFYEDFKKINIKNIVELTKKNER